MSSKLSWGARLVRQNVRRFTTSEKKFITKEEVEKVKQKQELYQAQSSEHIPIHMIAGKNHFYITAALGVLTLIFSLDSLYKVVNRK